MRFWLIPSIGVLRGELKRRYVVAEEQGWVVGRPCGGRHANEHRPRPPTSRRHLQVHQEASQGECSVTCMTSQTARRTTYYCFH